ncbi:MAG: FHA domain-containing protein [Planctomycetes bacterium]|nr:FHA domain-containing protein [Planctomycetota bacterium]
MTVAPTTARALILTVGRMTYEATAGETFRIGRHRTNQLVFNDKETSRFHAVIEWRDGVPMIRDLASLNGTFVGGLRIHEPTALRAGHRVLLGNLRVDVEVLEDVEEAPALLADETGEIRFFTEWEESELSGIFAQQVTFHRLLLDLEENGRTGTLTVNFGLRTGELTFLMGSIGNARHLHFTNRAALARILAARSGSYRFRPTFELQEAEIDVKPSTLLRRAQAGTRKHQRRCA